MQMNGLGHPKAPWPTPWKGPQGSRGRVSFLLWELPVPAFWTPGAGSPVAAGPGHTRQAHTVGTHGGLWNQGGHTHDLQQECSGTSILESKEEDRRSRPNPKGVVDSNHSPGNMSTPPSITRMGRGVEGWYTGRQGDCSAGGGPARVGGGQHPGQKGRCVCLFQREGQKMVRTVDQVHSGPTGSGEPWKDLARVVTGFGKAPTP